MGKGNHFIVAGKNHIVFANNRATTDGVHADFVLFPLHAASMAVIDIVIAIVFHFIDGICQHDCRAARCINFLIVVLFHDFNVKLVAQNGSCPLCQFDQQVNAQGHIKGEKDRNLFGCCVNLCNLCFTVTSGCQYQCNVMGKRIVQQHIQRRRVGKVDDDIRLFRQLFRSFYDWKAVILFGVAVNPSDDRAIFPFCNAASEGVPHFSVCTA